MKRAPIIRALTSFTALAAALSSTAIASMEDLPIVLPSEMGPRGSAKAFMHLQDFADCLIRHATGPVSKLLGTNYPSADADRQVYAIAGDYEFCLTRTAIMRFTTEYLRGALIEAAYHKAYDRRGDGVAIKLGKSSTGQMGLAPTLAECVVNKKPEAATQVLATPPGSARQSRAFAALQPELSLCARAENVKRIVPQLLRFQIAEALYRRASHQSLSVEAAK